MIMENKVIFVTVGTTKFDELVKTVLDNEILQAMNQKGYNEMIIQIGTSELIPDCTPRCGFKSITYFNMVSSLENFITQADLVISHAGAGTCLEVLEAKKPLVVVVNHGLMNNHQMELAEQLHKEGYAFCCRHDTLLPVFTNNDFSKLKMNFSDKYKQIAKKIDEILGFEENKIL